MTKIVYILTNQSMPDTIKIGITDNLERRIRELDNTSTTYHLNVIMQLKFRTQMQLKRKYMKDWTIKE